ncbi:MAG: hypothetical protein D6766_00550 [Verrucomicrobia bacterium]|nr:MAG: hypothetical protein D6766_00550 [Verrucomicrobiota bacterium]
MNRSSRSVFRHPQAGARGRFLLVLLAVWLGGWAGRAVAGEPNTPTPATPEAVFGAAKTLYEQGRYAEAAGLFEALWTNGVASVALHYNLGNAWLKAGEPGRAVYHYRLARWLAPRDPDVQANLEIARTMVRGEPPPAPAWWRRFLERWRLDEWTLAATAAFWLWVGLGVAVLLRPAWRERCRRPRQVCLGLFLALAVGTLAAWSLHPRPEAVVLSRDAVLLHGPRDEAPEVQPLQPGQELVVLERRGGWARVAGAERGVGWVRTNHLGLLPR